MRLGSDILETFYVGAAQVERLYLGSDLVWEPESGGGGATDEFFDNVVLLLGFEGADGSTVIVDESPSAHVPVCMLNAALDTGQFKFGTSSLILDGNEDRVHVPDSPDWAFGTGDFTIEGWFRFAEAESDAVLVSQWGGGWAFYIESGGLFFRDGAIHDTAKHPFVPVVGQWYHIAMDRDSAGNARIYVDGVMVVKTAGYNYSIPDSGSVLCIGSLRGGGFSSYDLNGHIDELRITKGVARYASDAGFAVPTEAFPRSAPVAEPGAAVSAQTWRLYITAVGSGTTASVAELKFYDTDGVEISTAGATITAQAFWGAGESPEKAIDGNAATQWAGLLSGGIGWLEVAFPAPVAPVRVAITCRASETVSAPKTFKLQYVNESSAYQDILSVVDELFWTVGETRHYGAPWRYWRILIEETEASEGGTMQANIAELEFRSVVGVAESPSGGRAFRNGRWSTGEDAPQAFDGNSATQWGTGAGSSGGYVYPWQLGYGYPTQKEVNEVLIRAKVGGQTTAPKTFKIQYTDPAMAWVDALSVVDEAAWASGEARTYLIP